MLLLVVNWTLCSFPSAFGEWLSSFRCLNLKWLLFKAFKVVGVLPLRITFLLEK